MMPLNGSLGCCGRRAAGALPVQLSCRLADSFEPTLETAAGPPGYQVICRESYNLGGVSGWPYANRCGLVDCSGRPEPRGHGRTGNGECWDAAVEVVRLVDRGALFLPPIRGGKGGSSDSRACAVPTDPMYECCGGRRPPSITAKYQSAPAARTLDLA